MLRLRSLVTYFWFTLFGLIFYIPLLFRLLGLLAFFTGGYGGGEFLEIFRFVAESVGLLVFMGYVFYRFRCKNSNWVFIWLFTAWLVDDWQRILGNRLWWWFVIGLLVVLAKSLVLTRLYKMIILEKFEVVVLFPFALASIMLVTISFFDINNFILVGEKIRDLTNWNINIFFLDYGGFLFLVYDVVLVGLVGVWLGVRQKLLK